MNLNFFILLFIFSNSLGFETEFSSDYDNSSNKNKKESNYYSNSSCYNSNSSIHITKKPFFSMFRSDNLSDRTKTIIKIDYLSKKIFKYQIELLDKDTVDKFNKYKDFHWQNWATNNLNLSGSNISNLFNQFNFYQFPEFIKFLKSIDNFDKHLKKLKRKLGDPEFSQMAQKVYLDKYETLQDFINNEFKKIQRQEAFLKQKESHLKKLENHRNTTFENEIRSTQEKLEVSDTLAHQLVSGDLAQCVQDQFLQEDLYKNNNFDNENYFNKEHKNYGINSNVEEFLLSKGLTTHKYKECFGNNIQHKIHSECLEILDKAYNLGKRNLSSESRNLSDEVIQVNDVSIEANKYGKINLATNLNKYSKATLKWIYIFSQGGPLVKWIHEGSWIGIQRVANTVIHPTELVQSSIKMGKSLYKIFTEIEGFLGDIQICNLINNPKRIQNRVEQYIENANQFCNLTTNFITEKSKNLTLKDLPEIAENITKEVTANVVEAYLTGKALSTLGNIISKTPKAINFVQNNFKALTNEKIVSLATMESGEVIQVRLVENGARLLAQDNNQVINKAKKLIHFSENQVKISATENGTRVIAANEAVNQIEKNKIYWQYWRTWPKIIPTGEKYPLAVGNKAYLTKHAVDYMIPPTLGLTEQAMCNHVKEGLTKKCINCYPAPKLKYRSRGLPLSIVEEVALNGEIIGTRNGIVSKKLGDAIVRCRPCNDGSDKPVIITLQWKTKK